MTESDAFLQAIIENPADDAPRLIYADWLDEHGQGERAEFIRVQCVLATIKPKSCPVVETGTECGKCRWCLLTEQEQMLYRYQPGPFRYMQLRFDLSRLGSRAVDMTFTESGPRIAGLKFSESANMASSVECVFRRGFIAEVTLACQDWLAHGPQLVKMTPLEKVTLSDRKPWRNFTFTDSEEFPVGWQENLIWNISGWAYELPPVIFERLTPPGSFAGRHYPIARYSTVESAVEDLSRACLSCR